MRQRLTSISGSTNHRAPRAQGGDVRSSCLFTKCAPFLHEVTLTVHPRVTGESHAHRCETGEERVPVAFLGCTRCCCCFFNLSHAPSCCCCTFVALLILAAALTTRCAVSSTTRRLLRLTIHDPLCALLPACSGRFTCLACESHSIYSRY